MSIRKKAPDASRLDQIVAKARQNYETREQGYRQRALKLFPWICGRCGREFDQANLRELTVHHIDHDHDNNPADGSNWELLCLYCHDNEHQKFSEQIRYGTVKVTDTDEGGGFRPFADLKSLLGGGD